MIVCFAELEALLAADAAAVHAQREAAAAAEAVRRESAAAERKERERLAQQRSEEKRTERAQREKEKAERRCVLLHLSCDENLASWCRLQYSHIAVQYGCAV